MFTKRIAVLLFAGTFFSVAIPAQSTPAQQTWVPTGKIYDVGGNVKSPVAIQGSASTLSKKSIEESGGQAGHPSKSGSVWLSLIVDETGLPRNVQVIKSDNEELNAYAMDAVARYRFHPATLKGQPVAVRLAVLIAFSKR